MTQVTQFVFPLPSSPSEPLSHSVCLLGAGTSADFNYADIDSIVS